MFIKKERKGVRDRYLRRFSVEIVLEDEADIAGRPL